jgi:hypothetical protein
MNHPSVRPTRESARFAYAVGEEIVAGLAGIAVFDVARSSIVTPRGAPPWTIGTIMERWRTDATSRYAIRFRYGKTTCVCVLPEQAIDGTA